MHTHGHASLLRRSPAHDSRGQAMTEFVIWVFVLLAMISGILWFGKAYDLKLQCHLASRYLAWSHAQVAETEFEDDLIMQRVQIYYPMTDGNPEYTRLDPASTFDGDALNPGGPSGDGFDVFSLMNGMFGMASNTQGWQVGASYAPGGILDQTLPDGTHVRSQHFVSGGAWHKKQIRGDLIIMGVKTGLFLWSMAVLNS
jgi:hypothetical protein